ncbi:hypothetical protein Dimus_009022 [Dionaea muscipula]
MTSNSRAVECRIQDHMRPITQHNLSSSSQQAQLRHDKHNLRAWSYNALILKPRTLQHNETPVAETFLSNITSDYSPAWVIMRPPSLMLRCIPTRRKLIRNIVEQLLVSHFCGSRAQKNFEFSNAPEGVVLARLCYLMGSSCLSSAQRLAVGLHVRLR